MMAVIVWILMPPEYVTVVRKGSLPGADEHLVDVAVLSGEDGDAVEGVLAIFVGLQPVGLVPHAPGLVAVA